MLDGYQAAPPSTLLIAYESAAGFLLVSYSLAFTGRPAHWHAKVEVELRRFAKNTDLGGISEPANDDSSLGLHLVSYLHLLLPLLECQGSLAILPEGCCILDLGFCCMLVLNVLQPCPPGSPLHIPDCLCDRSSCVYALCSICDQAGSVWLSA